jgi:site-specific DNA-methyltransferase (adenine-specific)
MIDLRLGNCLEVMRSISDKSVDAIICDLPYGTTSNKWDSVIPFEPLWAQYSRIIKDDGVIALTAQQPFTSMLICSNLELYRYNWIWKKNTPTGFLNCAYKPLTITEDICIFSKAKIGSLSKNPIKYNPIGVVEINNVKKNNPNSKWREQYGYGTKNNALNSNKEFIQKYTNYPNQIIEIKRDKETLHPTQKPVALMEYLVKTYTNQGDTVLDNCMGSGTTGVACKNLGRKFIGIEQNANYFEIAKNRIYE